jgi:hypothetical protein
MIPRRARRRRRRGTRRIYGTMRRRMIEEGFAFGVYGGAACGGVICYLLKPTLLRFQRFRAYHFVRWQAISAT